MQAESVDLQREGVSAAVEGMQLKSAKAQRAMDDARLQALRASLADDLTGGLCIMLAAALYYAVAYGFLEIRLGRCEWPGAPACTLSCTLRRRTRTCTRTCTRSRTRTCTCASTCTHAHMTAQGWARDKSMCMRAHVRATSGGPLKCRSFCRAIRVGLLIRAAPIVSPLICLHRMLCTTPGADFEC